MFVTTFYSYKGGVGRTMALANVAAELSRRGKSVLIADFDLEAPGVSSISFNNCSPSSKNTLGIVDFVNTWLSTGIAPDVGEYVMNCPASGEHGAIWIMPAGKQDNDYGTKLQVIDWADLYEKHDGYLLMEDLKRQWEAYIKPDYVLIDSRTGHTDIGGICTRQLPDLVAFVFWPNIQNLTGLELILAEMNAQETATSRKIRRLYVPSNLPTLDDEEELLKAALANFRTKLRYEPEDEVQIHNYQSIDFLKQLVFTAERPKTSIANEYRKLTDAIMASNSKDEVGMRLFLSQITAPETGRIPGWRRFRTGTSNTEKDYLLNQIVDKDWNDPQIHKLMATHFESEQDIDQAISALRKAIKKGLNDLDSNFQLARLLVASSDREDASEVIDRILGDIAAEPVQIAAALKLFSTISTTDRINTIVQAPALVKLTGEDWVKALAPLRFARNDACIAAKLLKSSYAVRHANWEGKGISNLCLLAIGGGEFEFGIELLNSLKFDVATAFNLAMARWGATHEVPKDEFERVAQLMTTDLIKTRDANFEQCFAMVSIALGNQDLAKRHINLSRKAAREVPSMFSCWSYLERRPMRFLEDLRELSKFSEGEPIVPSVFADAWKN